MYLIYGDITIENIKIIDIKGRDTAPEMQKDTVSINGLNYELLHNYGAYKLKSIDTEIYIIRDSEESINNEINYIRTKLIDTLDYKKIVFSDRSDEVFEGFVDDFIVEKITHKVYKINILFKVKPFKYCHESYYKLTLTTGETINNPLYYYSEPYIKLYGNGDITLTINSETITFNNVVDYIEINSELLECFKDDESCNDKMVGKFPKLLPGENTIVFTGASEVEIIPRWRCL